MESSYLKEVLILTYPNGNKAIHMDLNPNTLDELFGLEAEGKFKSESKFITPSQLEELKTCTRERYYQIVK